MSGLFTNWGSYFTVHRRASIETKHEHDEYHTTSFLIGEW